MAIESGNKPSKPQREKNKAASILLDTPEKSKQQFEVIAEDEEDSMSLKLLDLKTLKIDFFLHQSYNLLLSLTS